MPFGFQIHGGILYETKLLVGAHSADVRSHFFWKDDCFVDGV